MGCLRPYDHQEKSQKSLSVVIAHNLRTTQGLSSKTSFWCWSDIRHKWKVATFSEVVKDDWRLNGFAEVLSCFASSMSDTPSNAYKWPTYMIAACDKNLGIGKDGDIPWSLPKEYAYFRKITITTPSNDEINVCVMGKKTWDGIPVKYRPLDGRINVVLSSTHTNEPSNVPNTLFLSSIELVESHVEAMALSINKKVNTVYICGGTAIYKHHLPIASKIYLTRIETSLECDAFFPEFDESLYEVTQSEPQIEKGLSYVFHVYTRK